MRAHRRPPHRRDRQEGLPEPGAARLRGAGLSDDLAEALAARTEALCAIDSPIGHEGPICDHVEAWAHARFSSVRRVKNSLVVRLDPARPTPEGAGAGYADREARPHLGPGAGPVDALGRLGAAGAASGEGDSAAGHRPLVALCGHLDTVPPHPGDEGHAPRREDGRLVALGSSDMKAGLAVMMELAERVPREQRACDLVLVLYAREEGPFEENELGDVLREVPDLRECALAVCLEPTANRLQLGCVGSIHATLTFTGRAAHSARPWQGSNAVHAAGALLAHLATLPPRDAVSGGLQFREVMSVTRIEGGRARNIVPERCSLNLNYRFAPDKTLEAAVEDVKALAARFGAEAAFTDLSPACPAYADHPLVERFVASSGVAVEPKQAWTDVARLAAAGIPAVNFGPGEPAQAHQAGEWVELAELPRCYERLERWLRE